MTSDAPGAPRAYKSPQRSAAAAQTRERVVAAARDLLASPQGLQGFTLESVAKRAAVARLTVYNQFGSRRALLEAVFDDLTIRGGISRVAAAMSDEDPHVALARLVTVLCEFSTFGRQIMEPLIAASASDPELRETMQARNERRRRAISVLVDRMKSRGDVRADAAADLVDVLNALTSASFLAELTRHGRDAKDAGALLQGLVADAVKRASLRR